MRTVRIKVYQFSELSEQAKRKAINWYLSGNEYSFAWDCTLDDAENIGLKIEYLDDYRPNKGEFTESAEVTAHKIMENHGQDCSTYKTASDFLEERDKLVEKYSDGENKNVVVEGNEWEFDNELDELEKEFLNSLLEDYRIIYINYLEDEQSDEYVIRSIEANEYEFLEDGSIYR